MPCPSVALYATPKVYVLGARLQPLPTGMPSASCTSPGPDSPAAISIVPRLTAERFVANPFGQAGAPHVPHG